MQKETMRKKAIQVINRFIYFNKAKGCISRTAKIYLKIY